MSPLKSPSRESVSQREERLLALLASSGVSNGAQLALQLGVSLRTLRRDMARLTARGVPLQAERGRGGGVRISPRFGLGRLQLKDREALDLLLALAVAERLGSPILLSSLQGVRRKIAAAFPPEDRLRIARLRRRILHAPPASRRVTDTWVKPRASVVQAVQEAFYEQRALSIEYRSARGLTARRVEPHHLLIAWPAWYLLVWDHLRGEVRILRLDRIECARMTEETFQLREAPDMLVVARDLFAQL